MSKNPIRELKVGAVQDDVLADLKRLIQERLGEALGVERVPEEIVLVCGTADETGHTALVIPFDLDPYETAVLVKEASLAMLQAVLAMPDDDEETKH